jgi:hypothetical protein
MEITLGLVMEKPRRPRWATWGGRPWSQIHEERALERPRGSGEPPHTTIKAHDEFDHVQRIEQTARDATFFKEPRKLLLKNQYRLLKVP